MIALVLTCLPLFFIPIIASLAASRARLISMYLFAAVQHGIALYLYFFNGAAGSALSSIIGINHLAGAFLVGYTGLQLVSLLALPREEASRAILTGILLLSMYTVLCIVAVSRPLFISAFILSLFIPFMCSFMQRSDWRTTLVFLAMGIICSALVLIGSYGSGGSGLYRLNGWLLVAACLRLGIFPLHLWIRRMVMRLPLQWTILFFLSYPSIALLVPLHQQLAPGAIMRIFLHLSWCSCLYGGCLAVAQKELRAAFQYLLVSLFGIIGVGLSLSYLQETLSGVLFFWMSSGLAFVGFGLAIELLESRLGEISVEGHHGLIEKMPKLGILFLLFGLASVGFPGMCAFIGQEVMLSDIYDHAGWVVVPILAALSLNGITVVRWFFLIFYGPCTIRGHNLDLLRRERLAFFVLLALIVGIGIYPQPLFHLGSIVAP